MDFRKGNERDQMFFTAYSEWVDNDSWARIVDFFVDMLPIEQFGFANAKLNKEGNLPYHPADLFKLFLYGYRKKLRSATQLAEACKINMEVVWLMKGLRPSPRTINYFRADNGEAIEKAHRHFVKLLQSWELVDGELVALDGSKVRGQNSKKNNFNQKKLDRHIKFVEEKMETYFNEWEELEESNSKNKKSKQREIEDKIETLENRLDHFSEIQEAINESHDGQVSLTDPDARAVSLHRNIVEVGYNIQATADAKHNFLIDIFAGGVNDLYDLSPAAQRAQEILGIQKIDLLADKGYHNGAELSKCERMGVRTFVAPREQSSSAQEGFKKENFTYNQQDDTYTCPAGQSLHTNGRYFKKSNNYRFKRYTTKACETCPLRSSCTDNKNGRFIERASNEAYVERNAARVRKYYQVYRLRQQIIEPIFGILKRQWGMDHTILKTKQKVITEYRIAGLAYNLTRLVSVKGWNWIKKQCKKLYFALYSAVSHHRASQQPFVKFFCNFVNPNYSLHSASQSGEMWVAA